MDLSKLILENDIVFNSRDKCYEVALFELCFIIQLARWSLCAFCTLSGYLYHESSTSETHHVVLLSVCGFYTSI